MIDELARAFDQLLGRTAGPLNMRLILQPLMALILGLRAGFRDAKARRPPFLWALVWYPEDRRSLMLSGWKDIGKVFSMAIAIDTIYQLVVLRRFYPLQALIVASLLAIVPYAAIRGPAARIARLFDKRGF